MRWSSIVLAAALAVACGEGVARAETVVIRGATVLPEDGPAVADADLVLAEGRVLALGPRGKVTVPAGARVVEAGGKFVIPGLIDAHVHFTDERSFGDLFLAHGVTTVREMGNRLENAVDLRRNVEEGRRLGPEVVFVGPIIDGTPPTWPAISEVVDEPARVHDLLVRLKDAGVYGFKVYESLKPEVYDTIIEEAAKLGVPVVGHVPLAVSLRHVVESGQATIEHLDHFAQWLQPGPDPARLDFQAEIASWSSVDDAKERELIASLVAHKTRLDPTRVVIERYSDLMRGITPDVPEARYLQPGLRKAFCGAFAGRARADAATDEKHVKGFARSDTFLKRAHDAGVPILAGSDTPNPWVVPGVSLLQEVAELAKALGPEEALRSATIENARALGRTDIGRIAPGTRADLVVLDADPRADAGALRRIASVFVRGKELDAKAREAMLADLEAIAKKAAEAPATGFEAIAGELAPGKKPTAPELRLEGSLAPFPASFWMRSASFAREGGGSLRVLRAAGSMPIPYTIEEALEVDATGAIERYHVTRDMLGERHEATLELGNRTYVIHFVANGKPAGEAIIPIFTPLEAQGGLLMYRELDRLKLAVGEKTEVALRRIDLDKLVVAAARSQKVERVANEVEDPRDPRQSARAFVVVAGEDASAFKSATFWIGDGAAAAGFELELPFGRFLAKPLPLEGLVAPKKKYY